MTTESAVNVAALLAGVEPATLDAKLVDPCAALSALLAGLSSSRDARRPVNAPKPEPYRRAA